MLGIFLLFSSPDFFKQKSFRNAINVSNGLNPDLDQGLHPTLQVADSMVRILPSRSAMSLSKPHEMSRRDRKHRDLGKQYQKYM